jgi:hypothetical protein
VREALFHELAEAADRQAADLGRIDGATRHAAGATFLIGQLLGVSLN